MCATSAPFRKTAVFIDQVEARTVEVLEARCVFASYAFSDIELEISQDVSVLRTTVDFGDDVFVCCHSGAA